MKKISEEEENEMYNIIKTALFSLCDEKPNRPVEFLAKKMLEIVDGDSLNTQISRKSIVVNKPSVDTDDYNIKIENILNENYTKPFLENYKILDKVYGDVYLVEDLKIPEIKKVVKIIDKNKTDLDGLPEKTLESLLNLSHPNVINIYDIIEDEYNLYIIEDYCEGGDLFNFILKNKIFSEDLVKIIIKQLLDALVYLHGRGLAHTNIKPENILIFKQINASNINDITIKISDLASASLLSSKSNKINPKLISSPFYLAPEFIESNFNELSDLWSVGAIAYTLLCGKPPYVGKPHEIIFKILHENYEFTQYHSESAKSFISSLMNRDIQSRFNAKEALQHFWLCINSDKNIQNFDESKGVAILSQMSNFVLGKNLRRSVLSYIQSKKYYSEKNIDLLKLFKDIDKDGNGLLNVNEIFDKYGKFFPGTPEEAWKKVKQFVEKIDINNNGVIEYSEILTVSSLINKEINDSMLREVFNFYDDNGNGFIQAGDLKEIFEEMNLKEEYVQFMIDENDQDNDRRISYKEFYEMITKINL